MITIIIPLILGASLYYIICPEVYFVKIIDYYLNINLHVEFNIEQNILTKVLRNHFFDFIWAFSFTNALGLIFYNDTKVHLKYCIIPICVGVFFELLQKVRVVYGTFDALDILSEILGIASATLIILSIRRKDIWEKSNK